MKPSTDSVARAIESVLDPTDREPFAPDDFIARLEEAVVTRTPATCLHIPPVSRQTATTTGWSRHVTRDGWPKCWP
jgi:hypothetical protein